MIEFLISIHYVKPWLQLWIVKLIPKKKHSSISISKFSTTSFCFGWIRLSKDWFWSWKLLDYIWAFKTSIPFTRFSTKVSKNLILDFELHLHDFKYIDKNIEKVASIWSSSKLSKYSLKHSIETRILTYHVILIDYATRSIVQALNSLDGGVAMEFFRYGTWQWSCQVNCT